jgi:DNA-binding MarR family transcriptional regulator
VTASRDSLSYELHKLTARLDRAADAMLRDQAAVSYARFLALFAVTQGAETQRALSLWLGQSEPSTSRMVGVLTRAGWLEVSRLPGTGNRHQLRVTASGNELVTRCAELLEHRFYDLVERAGVSYEQYQEGTRRLLSQLDDEQQRDEQQRRRAGGGAGHG